jgi:hypothetical protein
MRSDERDLSRQTLMMKIEGLKSEELDFTLQGGLGLTLRTEAWSMR